MGDYRGIDRKETPENGDNSCRNGGDLIGEDLAKKKKPTGGCRK